MVRIAGVDLPDTKRVDIALTYLYGIGRSNVLPLLGKVHIEAHKRVKELTEEEIGKIQRLLDKEYTIEGDLRMEINETIKRLKQIGSYRGVRHAKNLPVRGQRTRANARTKRGKRQTIGAMKKDVRAKLEQTPTKQASAK